VKRKQAVESFRSAAECIGPIEPEMSLFALTRGQFSMIDMILHTLDQIGPSHVSVWTWVIADYEVDSIHSLMVRNELLSATLIVDTSGNEKLMSRLPILETWRATFGEQSLKICKNHAKIARIWNDRFRVLIRGSMNFNFNPRFEQLDITEGGPDFDLIERVEEELPVLPINCSRAEAGKASQVGQAFENSQLKMFDGIKVWAK